MGLNPLLGLVPDRADSQIALVDSERGLGFGQLDVCLPKVFGRPVRYVRSQKITSFVERCPFAPCVVFFPRDDRAATDVFDANPDYSFTGEFLGLQERLSG